jgi:hypothetical protein
MFFDPEARGGRQLSEGMGAACGEAAEFAIDGSRDTSPMSESVAEMAGAGVSERRRGGRFAA